MCKFEKEFFTQYSILPFSPLNDDDDENGSYTLTFNIEFQHDNDTVYFAHSYPYTYSDLQDYLMAIQRHPVKSKYCKLRLLCRSLAGNNIYYLTVTAPQTEEEAVKVSAQIFLPRSTSLKFYQTHSLKPLWLTIFIAHVRKLHDLRGISKRFSFVPRLQK